MAVLADGTYTENAGSELVYAPRTEEELNQITALVRSAVGFDENRDDTIKVANPQFSESPVDAAAVQGSSVPPMSMNDYFYIAKITILTLLAILVLLFVVRQIIEGENGTSSKADGQNALPESEGAKCQTQLITDQSNTEK